jgi:hypothetical protein
MHYAERLRCHTRRQADVLPPGVTGGENRRRGQDFLFLPGAFPIIQRVTFPDVVPEMPQALSGIQPHVKQLDPRLRGDDNE